MSFQDIKYEEKGSAAWIYLNRPEAFNAMTPAMNREIIRAVRQAEASDDVRAIVITGEGRAFCAGEDLGGVDEHTNHASFLRERYHPMLKTLEYAEKPVVALINGTAAGAGMSLALAADFRVMKNNAKFVSAFTDVGLVPDSGFLYYLPKLVGEARALDLALFSRPISAEEAEQLSLANLLLDQEEWDTGIEKFVQQLTARPTKAAALIKKLIRGSRDMTLDEFLELEAQAQRTAGMSSDHQEGLQAFREKRKAVFSGK
jgi:2-(1,2-epoxy-1,2-dihydrophenyl)acetyl-CoA isomerase